MDMNAGYGPPQGGMSPMMPPGGPGAFMRAAMAQQGGGMPQGTGPGAPPMGGAPTGPSPAMFQQWMAARQGGQPQGGMPQPPPGMQGGPGMPQGNPAAQGRFGDTQMAHVTPGEIQVPPEVQNPQVLATLKNAFQQRGVSPQQFTAGNPRSSINPATGMPEYSFMSAFLPIALGLAGNAIAPGVGSALGMAAGSTGAAALPYLLSGAGSALGGMATGQKPGQALMTGAGSALGSYGMGKLFAPAAEAATAGANAGGSALATGAIPQTAADLALTRSASNAAFSPGMAGARSAAQSAFPMPSAAQPSFWQNMMPTASDIPKMAGGAIGGYMGGQMAAPVKPFQPAEPRGFHDRLTPVSQLPSWDVLLGQNTYNGPRY